MRRVPPTARSAPREKHAQALPAAHFPLRQSSSVRMPLPAQLLFMLPRHRVARSPRRRTRLVAASHQLRRRDRRRPGDRDRGGALARRQRSARSRRRHCGRAPGGAAPSKAVVGGGAHGPLLMGEGARAAPNAVPRSRLLAVTLAAAQSLGGGGACLCNPTALAPATLPVREPKQKQAAGWDPAVCPPVMMWPCSAAAVRASFT